MTHSSFDHGRRISAARRLLGAAGIDALALSVGGDLPYLTGYEALLTERLTMLVLRTDGDGVLVVPRLEAPRVVPLPDLFGIRPWDETDDPLSVVVEELDGLDVVAVGDQTWAVFLLGMQQALPGTRFTSAAPITRQLRMRKDANEISLLRAAAAATDRVVERLAKTRFSGQTERQLAATVAEWALEEGHDTTGFAIVASGPNAASPHHSPSDRPIERGDTVVVDFGGRIGGYCSDTTRTFVVGDPSTAVEAAYRVLDEAQRTGVETVRPGVQAGEVDAVTREVIDEAGLGDLFIHRTGHGIGLEVHEHPYIVAGNDTALEPGMAFSVEPGIYAPESWGMRIEDIVAVTSDGVDRLNQSDRRLYVVG
ncbi:MAG TPA: Xaa-Pro peptidase family protein [Acidimicrobiia bacterium]|nr:Xaa-Pro peptidase family protein [Acidimicrobiia bacterium]